MSRGDARLSGSRLVEAALVSPTGGGRPAAPGARPARGPPVATAVDAVGCLIAAVLGALFLSPALHDTATRCRPRRLSSTSLRGCWPASRCGGGGAGRSASRSPACCWGRSRSRPPRRACSRCSPWPCTARSGRAAGRRAVDPVLAGLRRLQPDDRPGVGGCAGHPARARRHRVGDVRPGPASTASSPCASGPCGRRPTSVCTKTGPGWPSAPGSPARCTTCSPTGSRCWRCTPVRSRSGPTCRRRRCGRPPSCCARRPARPSRSCAASIGLLREEPGNESAPAAPQPTLSDIRRLVEETRRAGAEIDFEMRVEQADAVPGALGRDAYRIVQEALTNIGKHASGTATQVRVSGAPGAGLHVSVRNRQPVHAQAGRRCRGPAPACSGCRNASPSPAAPWCTARTAPATSSWTPSCQW